MLPEIGIMVGCYIVTRMFSFFLRTGDRKEHLSVEILAGVTALVALVVVVDLVMKGFGFSSGGSPTDLSF